jgi:hypothetical protein
MVKVLLAFFLWASACSTFAPPTVQSKRSTDLEARRIKRIAVLVPSGIAPDQRVQATYTANPADKEEELSEMLARLVYSAMVAMPNWQIVSDSEVREVAQGIPPGADVARLQKIGQMVYADAVIVGRVERFRERIGNEWGAKSPASVSFVLNLIDIRRGDTVWSARFDETQKPLSENVFALGQIGQRGIRWLSAEQLTDEGVKKAVAQLHQILAPSPTSS